MRSANFMAIDRKYELLDGVFRSSIHGIAVINPSCEFVFVNEAFERMTGYSYGEIVGHNRKILRGENTDPVALELIDSSIVEGRELEIEVNYHKKDGSQLLCHLVLTPVFDFDNRGRLIYSVGIFRDLSMRIQMEQLQSELCEGTNLLEAYKEAIDASSIVSKTDIHGNITYANDEFCRISGYTKEELIGKNHNIVRSPNMPKTAFEELWKTILAKKTWKGIVENRAKDGSTYIVDATIKPILDRFGEIVEFISIRHEITEVINAKREAQEALKMKSSFFAKASHELRTPLNAIINFVEMVNEDFDEMLSDSETRETNRDFLRRIEKNAHHLRELISDVLDISKLEAQKGKLKLEAVDICDTLNSAYENMHSLALKAGLELRLTIRQTPLFTSVNERNFLQIIMNLLSNAIKFTKEGSVELFADCDEEAITVEVRDTGRGIPADKLQLIFEPFVQVESFDMGTGLGLKIVKEMCKAMNIDLSVRSVENEGTIFALKLKKAAM